MGNVDIIVKKNDTMDWTFQLSDVNGTVISLVNAEVAFELRRREAWPTSLFDRATDGTGSDFISVSSPASDGILTVTPTASDWVDVSDVYGIYRGEFRIQDSDGAIQYTPDVLINVQEEFV